VAPGDLIDQDTVQNSQTPSHSTAKVEQLRRAGLCRLLL